MIATIQEYTSVSNGIGGSTKAWVNVDTIEGTLDMLSGDKTEIANQQTVNSTHIFICEPTIITTDNRLVIGGDIYHIKYVDNPMGMDVMFEIYLEYKGLLQ